MVVAGAAPVRAPVSMCSLQTMLTLARPKWISLRRALPSRWNGASPKLTAPLLSFIKAHYMQSRGQLQCTVHFLFLPTERSGRVTSSTPGCSCCRWRVKIAGCNPDKLHISFQAGAEFSIEANAQSFTCGSLRPRRSNPNRSGLLLLYHGHRLLR